MFSECPKFHPNQFTSGGVIAKCVNTVKTHRRVFPIFGSSSQITRELPGERSNAKNNAWCMQARKTMHGLDRQHQYVDRTPCGRVNQNDRG